MGSYPGILFLDQSGELGGAELCLADLAEFCREDSAVLLLQDGPFRDLLEKKDNRTSGRNAEECDPG